MRSIIGAGRECGLAGARAGLAAALLGLAASAAAGVNANANTLAPTAVAHIERDMEDSPYWLERCARAQGPALRTVESRSG